MGGHRIILLCTLEKGGNFVSKNLQIQRDLNNDVRHFYQYNRGFKFASMYT